MTTSNLFQALQEAETNASNVDGTEIDYVSWAKSKFTGADGALDINALAKGKWESDMKFVPRILEENSEMRKEIETRVSLQDFMDKWESSRTSAPVSTSSTPASVESNATVTTKSLSTVDIEKLVDEKLTKKQREQIARANVAQVTQALVEKWGTGHVEKLRTRAQTLGVNDQFLAEVAERSPKAFLELVLGGAPAAPNAPVSSIPPRSSTRTPHPTVVHTGTTGGHKTKREWDEVRRTSPQEYWKVSTQQQVIKDSNALGDEFFK